MRTGSLFLAFLILTVVSVAALAQPAPQMALGTNGTTVTSEHLEFDYKNMTATFEGNVVVEDPQMRLEAARMTVLFEGQSSVKQIIAVGKIRMRHEDMTATCDKAGYLATEGKVVLSGNARVVRGKDTVAGNTITVWTQEERMTCEPGVLTILPPSGETNKVTRGFPKF